MTGSELIALFRDYIKPQLTLEWRHCALALKILPSMSSLGHRSCVSGRHTGLRETLVQVKQIISAHPDVKGRVNEALIRCIEECYGCAQTCISCADACVAEQMVTELRQCIRLDLDCADICNATGAVATRRTGSNEQILRQMLEVCAAACKVCGDECERHASKHQHCRICAEVCRSCEQACRAAADAPAL
jgi:hypothetical protein